MNEHELTLRANWDPDETPAITGWHATCGCGWTGVEQNSESAAAADGRSHAACAAIEEVR